MLEAEGEGVVSNASMFMLGFIAAPVSFVVAVVVCGEIADSIQRYRDS